MPFVIFFALLLLLLTTLMHYEVLVGLSRVLPGMNMPPRLKLVLVIFGAFGSHLLQILLYGAAYYLLSHAFGNAWALNTSLYFSAETFTSLGFGDIVPTGAVRLLAGTECLNGLLLIGWSASYTYISMERFWQQSQ